MSKYRRTPTGYVLSDRCRACHEREIYAAGGRKKVMRARHLWRKYKLREREYDEMLERQGGVCAICRESETRRHARTGELFELAVDHDHRTGRVRGLLCTACNNGLRTFGDDVERLVRAANYLSTGHIV